MDYVRYGRQGRTDVFQDGSEKEESVKKELEGLDIKWIMSGTVTQILSAATADQLSNQRVFPALCGTSFLSAALLYLVKGFFFPLRWRGIPLPGLRGCSMKRE